MIRIHKLLTKVFAQNFLQNTPSNEVVQIVQNHGGLSGAGAAKLPLQLIKRCIFSLILHQHHMLLPVHFPNGHDLYA